jgi:hypothetical protein
VRIASHFDPREQPPIAGIEGVNFMMVSACQPEYLSVSGEVPHIRASSARDLPFSGNLTLCEIDQGNAPFVPVGNVKDPGVAADV